ncbi:MAG: hypothetical protein LBR60_00350 [Fibrobacter sp.]|jgi:hypothetical protein|nr:hypothetical protein [Fibrobacter sp.]
MKKCILLLSFVLLSPVIAEEAKEKSLWDSFVSFFTPKSKPEGEGALHEELRALDNQIRSEKLAYNRERRPQKKSRIRMNLDNLEIRREALVIEIQKQAMLSSSSSSVTVVVSSSAAAPVKQPEIALVYRDTVLIRDTVWLRDTVWMCAPDSAVTDSSSNSGAVPEVPHRE